MTPSPGIQDLSIEQEFEWFHRHPELAFEEFETSKHIKEILSGLAGVELLDLGLPDLDGLETAQAHLEEYKDASIIMVSSLAYDDTFEEAKAIGAKGFIDKPFEKEQLLEAFAKALS